MRPKGEICDVVVDEMTNYNIEKENVDEGGGLWQPEIEL